MIRFLLWLLGGVVLGGIIHLVVILSMPLLAEETLGTRLQAFGATNHVVILPQPGPGEANPLALDPALVYGICQVDLADAPVYLRGRLPDAFWSVALVNRSGVVAYSTTNRDGIGQTLDLGIFNAAQTRLLAQQQIDVAEGVLIVESRSDDIFVLIRLAPPNEAVRSRFQEALAAVTCSTGS